MRIYGGLVSEKCLPQTRVFWGALVGEAMEPSGSRAWLEEGRPLGQAWRLYSLPLLFCSLFTLIPVFRCNVTSQLPAPLACSHAFPPLEL